MSMKVLRTHSERKITLFGEIFFYKVEFTFSIDLMITVPLFLDALTKAPF